MQAAERFPDIVRFFNRNGVSLLEYYSTGDESAPNDRNVNVVERVEALKVDEHLENAIEKKDVSAEEKQYEL